MRKLKDLSCRCSPAQVSIFLSLIVFKKNQARSVMVVYDRLPDQGVFLLNINVSSTESFTLFLFSQVIWVIHILLAE
jgi:hypothetical protein